MDLIELLRQYQELQEFVAWSEADIPRLRELHPLLSPCFPGIVDDFYAEIRQHPNAMKVITGGEAQIERLKGTLRDWLDELFRGPYDMAFVARRFRVGRRHVDIGLAQFYANVSLARIRMHLIRETTDRWTGTVEDLRAALESLNRVLDLDLAIIDYAYQTEFAAREQRQERLVTLGQIAAGIAHELRNPLNAIKTSVYYLLNAKQPSPEKQREHLQRIDRQVGISDHVITALSNFARMPMPNLHPVVVREFLQRVIDENPLPGGIEIEVDCPEDLPAALADSSQLAIALGNLVRNAVDAMPDGGKLLLRARVDPAQGAPQDAHQIMLEVTDTGVGISPDVLTRIMEPLFSTKTRGLGLGLALTRAIVEKHGGRISVTSTPGVGSTFTVTLRATPTPL